MRPRHITATLAVAALYALLLQGFLGALAPTWAGAGVPHCAPGSTSGAPAHEPAPHDGACCLLACRPLLAPPPGVAAPAARVARTVAALRPADETAGGPAPRAALRARGPPAA